MAKDSLFGNIFDVDADTQSSREKSALSLAALSPGRVQVAGSGMAGSMLGGGVMEGLGYQNPEQQKQQAINEVWQEVGKLDLDDAANRKIVGNAFIAKGLHDIGMDILQYDDKTTSTKDSRGTLQKSVEYMAELNQCSKFVKGSEGHQACMQKSLADAQKYKRPGEDETGKIGGVKSFQETLSTVRESQKQYRGNISTLTSLKSLIPQIYTGTGQGIVAAWNKVGTILNFEDATNAQAATEAFRSGGLEVAMQYIHATKGAVSDMEMTKFIEASPNLHNTQLGNIFIIEFALARQRREQKLLSAMSAFARKYPGATTTDWLIKEDELLQTDEYDISKKLEKAYDAARNDPLYTGLSTKVVTDGNASTDIESQINELEESLK